jgi:serine/threonine protein kinase/tetratricopeptide (TPR) repeat protein
VVGQAHPPQDSVNLSKTQERIVSQPDRNDLFLGWNLGSSSESERLGLGRTRSWPASGRPAPGWNNANDKTRPAGPIQPIDVNSQRGLPIPGHLDGNSPPTDSTNPDQGPPPIPFPNCGETIGGFRLVSELGRGAFGRVYLAEEAGLGNRPVALKVTRAEGDEPRLLARLQHTHIVPIHSVMDDPETGLRLMCMPYFGGANLAQVLEATGHHQSAKATGLSLIEALDIVGRPSPSDSDDRTRSLSRSRIARRTSDGTREVRIRDSSGAALRSILGRIPWWSRSVAMPTAVREEPDPANPSRRFLRESSFVRASVWIVARLAEGLEHAHSRGLLHRDLKPSNILIAADGTPMLLDFNLAAETMTPDEADRAMIGGTLPYMAPEHLDAFNPEGTTPPEDVDERADIYALGLILFEMIAGQHPFPEPPPALPMIEIITLMTIERRCLPPSPRDFNPEIPRGLDAIVRKAIDPCPARRHARAGDLAEDLRRFLDDRPLKFAPERSLTERFAKWARRNPKITGATPVAAFSVALIVLIGGAAWTLSHHLQQVSARLKMRVFERSFLESQFLLNIANGPSKDVGRGIGLAEQAMTEAGVGPGAADPSGSWLKALEPDEQIRMRGDLAELIMLTSRARVYQAERSKSEAKRKKALTEAIDRLNQAERLDPNPSQSLYADRARYHAALGQAKEAASDRDRRDRTVATTGRDFYLLGTSLLVQGQYDRAESALLKAIGLDPRRFWGWFSLGLCHYEQGRFAESAGDFAVCAVLAPNFTWPWMNRGLALARAGRLIEAREAYDRAVAADPKNTMARVDRALTSLELDDAPAAVKDLEQAVADGAKDASTRAALAEALARAGRRDEALATLGELIRAEPDATLPRVVRGMIARPTDPKLAEADFRHVLSRNPRDAGANLGLARVVMASDPKAALEFADQALAADPNRLEALELRAWLRGKLGDPRVVEDVERLTRTPTPHRLYNAACALALLNEKRPDANMAAKALELLRRALESGFPVAGVKDDPDFQSLRANPSFQKWTDK